MFHEEEEKNDVKYCNEGDTETDED